MPVSLRRASRCLVMGLVLLSAAGAPPAALARQEPPPEDPNPPRFAATLPPDSVPPTDDPAPPAEGAALAALVPGTRMVFQAVPGENWEVYIADDDRANRLNLSNHNAADIHPSLNRGVTRVVYASNRTGNFDLFGVNPDGGGLLQLTSNGADDVSPDWSPDGSRIVFQSYRDGQAEVYVMNSDGSGQTRLTNSPGFDGQPTWSPDGSRIAFTAYRNSQWRIWSMNPDGTGQTQVSGQAYSENPVWSPDSTQLAFDADSDSNGWTELWRVNADGSGAVQTFVPGDTVDAYAGSWVPSGEYMAFTQVAYTNIGGTWYWYSAHICFLYSGGAPCLGFSDSTEWNPDWRSTDGASPVSSLVGLPATAPANFGVRWTGSDVGSGVANYDVQVSVGSPGNWQPWQTATTGNRATYTGQGGVSYYFRARARDVAGNYENWPAAYDTMTTVESLPPQSSIHPLPAYSPVSYSYPPQTYSWSGTDPGNSGILHYDVQVSTSQNPAWLNVLQQTTATEYVFGTGESGVTYYLRVRATDHAGNVEPWPVTPDAQTTWYNWTAQGPVQTNSGVPIVGAAFDLTPDGLFAGPGTGEGQYAAFAVINSNSAPPFSATFSKAGYGSLPYALLPADGGTSAPRPFSMVLPPADNLVANWGFETGSLGPGDWASAGPVPVTLTDTLRHTGDYAAVAGVYGAFTSPQPLSGTATGQTKVLHFVRSADGTLHALWNSADLLYSRRAPGGAWSSPEPISSAGSFGPDWAGLAVAEDGQVHTAWVSDGGLVMYAHRATNGTWDAPSPLSAAGSYGHLALAVDGTGGAHVMWQDNANNSGPSDVFYRYRSPAGAWTPAQNLSQTPTFSWTPQLAVNDAGAATVVWEEFVNPNRLIRLRRRVNGTWGSVQTLATSDTYVAYRLGLTEAGDPHLLGHWNNQNWYVRCPGGTCGNPQPVPEDYSSAPDFVTDPDGTVHALWVQPSTENLWYGQRSPAGAWAAPSLVDARTSAPIRLAHTPGGSLYVAGVGGPFPSGLQIIERNAAGAWSKPVRVPQVGTPWQVLADPTTGGPQVLSFLDYVSATVFHQAPLVAVSSGASVLAQAVSIPGNMPAPHLSFFYQTGGLTGARPFSVTVNPGSGPVTVFTTATRQDTWTHVPVDVSAWAGQTITVSFGVAEEAGKVVSYALVDEVSLGSAPPDTWVALSGPTRAVNGNQVQLVLAYGNRSPAPASGLVLTLQLSPHLHYVSASPAPIGPGSPLTWNTSGSSGIITVTATVGPGATLFASLESTAGLATAAGELEAANNTAAFTMQVLGWLSLPFLGDLP